MKILESVRGMAFLGTFVQARLFSAACAEHTAGVLLQYLADEGRPADQDTCVAALELLWDTAPPDENAAAALHRRLSGLPELGQEFRPSGVQQSAVLGFRALVTGVAMLIDQGPDGAVEPSQSARALARELDGESGTTAAEEDAIQDRDIERIMSWSPQERTLHLHGLRAASAETGRDRLAAARARHGLGDGAPDGTVTHPGSVTATVDRGDVAAAEQRARYGVVGRITAGSDAGGYLRVDRSADLSETPEERASAAGVIILVAADPAMTRDCVGEWVEDWAGVEKALRQDGRQVDWDAAP
ncbi:hypothetical protein [Streptomyces brevispora]|uniref:Uncharacterized protein n=1 Tax=Streptomyces brevispora TaxID=887462 RepID=A0A561V0R0_9ACTN|nr:hypothetical protein [Streptomyces brevispora]TWG05180.1 hypothetical protein FHX80_113656 [Streptomyces brevispora]WSC13778.1 hypothetical protein OIE64_13640 [Streptomyces brevispora]